MAATSDTGDRDDPREELTMHDPDSDLVPDPDVAPVDEQAEPDDAGDDHGEGS